MRRNILKEQRRKRIEFKKKLIDYWLGNSWGYDNTLFDDGDILGVEHIVYTREELKENFDDFFNDMDRYDWEDFILQKLIK